MSYLEKLPLAGPFSDLRVLGLMADEAACGHYRIKYPLQALAEGGATVQLHQGMLALSELQQFDVILAQRQFHPVVLEMLQTAQHLKKTVLFEIDDNVHAVHRNSPVYNDFRPGSAAYEGVRKTMQHCDGLFTSSAELASQYAKWNKRTWVLPNQIDFGYREWETEVPRDPRLEGKIVIGWAGSITHQDDAAPLAGVLPVILERYPQAIFAIVSAYQTMDIWERVLEVPKERVVRLDPKPFVDYPPLLAQFDIGLAPVINTDFNRGKCLDEVTRVSTPRGLTQVGDLKPGDAVWNGKEWAEVIATERQPEKQGLRVRTRRGYELLMTDNHRIMAGYGWTRADELQVGSKVPLSPWEFSQTRVAVPFPLWDTRHSRKETTFNAADGGSLPRIEIDPTWGEILGLFAGDGNINNTHIRISVDGQDEDLVARIIDLFGQIGLSASARHQKTYSGEACRAKKVRVSSRKLVEFLEYLGVSKNSKRLVRVPEVIWHSPKPVVAAFLRGYFEADSHCGKNHSIQAASKDIPFLREVQQLLLGFGITSRLKLENGYGRYADRVYGKLTLIRAEMDIFAREIGFLSKRKQATLDGIVNKPHSNAYRPLCWEDEIVSIEPEMLQPVDIQVDGQVFIAAGWVSHNSELKLLEYGARKVPYVASRIAPYNRLHLDTGGQGGYLCNGRQEWVDALATLVECELTRKACAEFMYDYVKNERSMRGNAYRWAEAMREAMMLARAAPEVERKFEVQEKPGRNDLCPCGSGTKYKRCCSPAWG